jgi:hypothetical protein
LQNQHLEQSPKFPRPRVFVHDEVAHQQPSLNITKKTKTKIRHVGNNWCTALKLVWTVDARNKILWFSCEQTVTNQAIGDQIFEGLVLIYIGFGDIKETEAVCFE